MFVSEFPQDAECRGATSSLFFPDSLDGRTNRRLIAEARQVCARCEVSRECYDFAQTSNRGRKEQYGVWAGVDFERWNREKRTEIVTRSRKRQSA